MTETKGGARRQKTKMGQGTQLPDVLYEEDRGRTEHTQG